jgi:hypothetical protein
MRLEKVFAALLAMWLIGCATPTQTCTPLRITTTAILTQRAVLTIHGRQFTLDGYLALSENYGMRLIVMQSLGQVIADVLVKPDGSMCVVRVAPGLRREWIERYMVRDLKCLFGNVAGPCPVHTLDGTKFIVQDWGYTLVLRTVETKPGPLPAQLFDNTRATSK